MAGWGGAAESDLKAAGAEALPDGRSGVRLRGWHIESSRRPILGYLALQEWEEKLGTSHLPQMVFGESSLYLLHEDSGIKLHFNAFYFLTHQKFLIYVEGPSMLEILWASGMTLMLDDTILLLCQSLDAVLRSFKDSLSRCHFEFKGKPFQQVILDYNYTFTTPYCGSEAIEPNTEKVVLYEDELADSGVSLLTVKVRVTPSCWFLLLLFWVRVDGALMRFRDTRVYCPFASDHKAIPVILRESCWREAKFQSLSAKGFPSDSAAYGDPNLIGQKLPVITHKT